MNIMEPNVRFSRSTIMRARHILALVAVPLIICGLEAADKPAPPLKFTQRYPLQLPNGQYETRTKPIWIRPTQMAIIVCDMWDSHHCLNAVRRVEELVPVMNGVLEKARGQGMLIIHAPSSCMEPYKDHPARK